MYDELVNRTEQNRGPEQNRTEAQMAASDLRFLLAPAAVSSTDTPKDDGGLLAAVTALTDAAKAGSDSSDSGDGDAARAAEALRASTSTAEESVEPAPQFVDDGDASEGDSSAE